MKNIKILIGIEINHVSGTGKPSSNAVAEHIRDVVENAFAQAIENDRFEVCDEEGKIAYFELSVPVISAIAGVNDGDWSGIVV